MAGLRNDVFPVNPASEAIGQDEEQPSGAIAYMILPWGTLVLDPLKENYVFVTSACARRTGADTRVKRRRRERCALCLHGCARPASLPEWRARGKPGR